MTFSVIYNPIATKFSQAALDHLVYRFIEKGFTLYKVAKSEYSGHVIKLIKELDPTGSLKIYGYINTADYDHRFGVIETKTNADGEFVISSTKFC